MTKPLINVAEAETHSGGSGETFAHEMTELSLPLGARQIGANLTRVPPGKAAFPFHHHHGNEEHFFILSGTGVLRLGARRYEVKPQDYIVNLPGGPESAHQLINTGAVDLVYLAISTSIVPEVVGYPDSGKTGVRPSSLDDDPALFRIPDSAKNTVAYWDGEDGAAVAAVVAAGTEGSR